MIAQFSTDTLVSYDQLPSSGELNQHGQQSKNADVDYSHWWKEIGGIFVLGAASRPAIHGILGLC